MNSGDDASFYLYTDSTFTFTFNKIIVDGHGSTNTTFEVDTSGVTLSIVRLEVHSEKAAQVLRFDNVSPTVIAVALLLVSGTPYSRTTINSFVAADAANVNVTASRIYFADIKDMNFSSSVTAFCSTSVSGNTNLVLSTSALCKTVGASMSSYCQPNIY